MSKDKGNKGNTWKSKNKALNSSTDSNSRRAYDYFVRRGLTPAQSAGIVGNLAQESTVKLDSSAENSIGAFGIAQWLGTRRTDLNNFAKKQGKEPSDFNMQLDFIWHELNTTEKRAFNKLKEATSAGQAAEIFVNKFERSGEKKGDTGFDNRVRYANQFMSSFNPPGVTPTPEAAPLLTAAEQVQNPFAQNAANMFTQDYVALSEQFKTQEAQKKDAINSDAVKLALQDKIDKRNFLIDYMNASEIEFIPAKRSKIGKI